jgi:DNA-binding NarL/FixJ family response regulator
VADSEPVFGVGVRDLVGAEGIDVEIVDAPGLMARVPGAAAVLLDAALGRGPYAVELVEAVRAADPDVAVVVTVDRVRPAGLVDVLEAGARAVVHRGCLPEELVTAVLAALRGQTWLSAPIAQVLREQVSEGPAAARPDALTPRETDVLRALAAGGSNAVIGARLGISEHTVRNHVHALLGKLGAANRTDAVTTAMRRGLVELAE